MPKRDETQSVENAGFFESPRDMTEAVKLWKELTQRAIEFMEKVGGTQCYLDRGRKCGPDCVAFELKKVKLSLPPSELKKIGISFLREEGGACGFNAVCNAGKFTIVPLIESGRCEL
jgi:hypothetical protein